MAGSNTVSNDAFTRIQNEPMQIEILQARRCVQEQGTVLLLMQIALVVLLPSCLAVISFLWVNAKPAAALISLLAAAIDVLVLDRMQKQRLVISAKLQEGFDCYVFELPWNAYVAGDPVDSDTRSKLAKNFRRSEGNGSIHSWYPASLSALPLEVARLAAQRLNQEYDARVRSYYKVCLLAVGAVLLISCSLAAYEGQPTLSSLILGVMVPLVPIANWCAREFFRQHDATRRLGAVRSITEGDWRKVLEGNLAGDAARDRSRRIQDASYIRRSTAPMIFQKLYWGRRALLERQMQASAEGMVAAAHAAGSESLGARA